MAIQNYYVSYPRDKISAASKQMNRKLHTLSIYPIVLVHGKCTLSFVCRLVLRRLRSVGGVWLGVHLGGISMGRTT